MKNDLVFFFACSEAWRRRRAGLKLHKQAHQIHRQSDAAMFNSERTEQEDQKHDYDPNEEM